MSAMKAAIIRVATGGGSLAPLDRRLYSRPTLAKAQGGGVDLQINGKAVQADAESDMSLLWVLRDLLNMTGTKFGCGVAACGACTVRVDGQAVRSCVTPAGTVVGKRIQTIESL